MISLPSFVTGCLARLDEASGSTAADSISDLTVSVANPNWSARGTLTLAANTSVTIPGNQISDLMRLDTLDGSVMVFLDVNHKGQVPSGNSYLWSYGDIADTTNGALMFQLSASLNAGALFAQRAGSAWQTTGGNVLALLRTDAHPWNSYGYVLHRINGRVYQDGYYNGFHSRSGRIFGLEEYEFGAVPDATGLRIGARANGAGDANAMGSVMTSPSIRNFLVLRIDGDWRHRIPGWIRNIHQSLPIGQTPRILRGITA